MKIERKIKIKNNKKEIKTIYYYNEYDNKNKVWIKCKLEEIKIEENKNKIILEIITKLIIGTTLIGIGLYQMINIKIGG